MSDHVDLEIGLHHRGDENWTVELQCTRPDEDVDVRLVRDGPRFDLDELRRSASDDVAYGRLLTDSLFAVPEVKQLFAMARVAAASGGLPLRLRLFVGPNASELQDVRWETLRDPDTGASLLTDEKVLFSRYLSSLDWRPVAVRPKAALRVLVAIANPSDLASYRPGGQELAPIPVDDELSLLQTALDPVQPTVLASGGSATLDGLVAGLHDGCDILVLVCHGYLAHGEPQLLLETATGTAARVPGGVLVERLGDLRETPRLVMLASCESAGGGDGLPGDGQGALAALGPRLAEAGVPAVVAMHGRLSMATLDLFLPAFFRELHRDGQIDRAMAVARGAVRQRPDWWMPVLFMRLKSGRVWYTPGFADAFEQWPALLADIRQGRCTPILGPGLTDFLLGTREEIAARWASQYHFPLAAHERHDLAHVAQYLAISLNYRFPRESLREHLRAELLDRYHLPEELKDASLDELVKAAAEQRWGVVGFDEPHAALAAMPFPLYVTADPVDLLPSALVLQGKQPQVELCRWSEDVEWPRSVYELMPDYRPDVRHPLVYHLFGNLRYSDTVALTLDDYDDFLIGVTSNRDLIPAVVRRALSDTALLFLGFRLDHGDFRVLFRSIMRQEGRSRRRRYSHVAVQIDPEESTTLVPERARRYMQQYFGGADISIYWGSAESFVRELQRAWEQQLR